MEHIILACQELLRLNLLFSPLSTRISKRVSSRNAVGHFSSRPAFNLDGTLQTDDIFLDFAKAFDTVPHKRLLLKLSQLNLQPNIGKWIEAFLTNRSQFVLVNNHYSSRLPVTSGVTEGFVLELLLF